MSKKTPHGALKSLCLTIAQRRNTDVTFHNHPVGNFIPAREFEIFLKAGIPPHPMVINRRGEWDVWIRVDGGTIACAEFKAPGDSLSPEQISERENLISRRIPHMLVEAKRLEDFDATAAAFSDWVAGLRRG